MTDLIEKTERLRKALISWDDAGEANKLVTHDALDGKEPVENRGTLCAFDTRTIHACARPYRIDPSELRDVRGAMIARARSVPASQESS